jgi:tetratricopeptide (TPR) repeat protein
MVGIATPDGALAPEPFSAADVDVIALHRHAALAAEGGAQEAVELTVRAGFLAGPELGRLFDYERAASVLSDALERWRSFPAHRRQQYSASRAYAALGWTRHALGDEAGAARSFDAAVATAQTELERARASMGAARHPYQPGEFERSENMLLAALDSVEDAHARALIEAELGWIAGRRGRWAEAREMLESAVARLQGGASPAVLARALDRLGIATTNVTGPVAALVILERAMLFAHQAADWRLEASVRTHRASSLRRAGRLAEAREEAYRAVEMSRVAGDRYMESVTHWTAAEVEHASGNLTEAIAERRREIEILQTIGGNPQNEAMARAHVAFIARQLSDTETELAELALARSVANASGDERIATLVEEAIGAPEWLSAL